MLKITEHTPRRLVLEDRRISVAIFAAFFSVVSAFSVLVMLFQGIEALFVIGRTMTLLRLIGLMIFIGISIGFTGLGIAAAIGFANGISCVLDKDMESFQLKSMNIFRRQQQSGSIYAISHLAVEKNTELKAYAVFIVLRSGERLTLAAFHEVDEVPMRQLIQQVRAFLHE